MTKSLLQSKTVWIAILQGVAGIIAAVVLQHPELGGALMLKSVIDIIIRLNTDSAIN